MAVKLTLVSNNEAPVVAKRRPKRGSNKEKWPTISGELPIMGIYFLYQKGQIQYVGQTKNLTRRLTCHRHSRGGQKKFDVAYYLPCPHDLLFVLESLFIALYQPPLHSVQETRLARLEPWHRHIINQLPSYQGNLDAFYDMVRQKVRHQKPSGSHRVDPSIKNFIAPVAETFAKPIADAVRKLAEQERSAAGMQLKAQISPRTIVKAFDLPPGSKYALLIEALANNVGQEMSLQSIKAACAMEFTPRSLDYAINYLRKAIKVHKLPYQILRRWCGQEGTFLTLRKVSHRCEVVQAILDTLDVRPGSIKEKVITALGENFNKPVLLSELIDLVYRPEANDEWQKKPCRNTIHGVWKDLKTFNLPYEIVRRQGSCSMAQSTVMLRTRPQRSGVVHSIIEAFAVQPGCQSETMLMVLAENLGRPVSRLQLVVAAYGNSNSIGPNDSWAFRIRHLQRIIKAKNLPYEIIRDGTITLRRKPAKKRPQ